MYVIGPLGSIFNVEFLDLGPGWEREAGAFTPSQHCTIPKTKISVLVDPLVHHMDCLLITWGAFKSILACGLNHRSSDWFG